MANLAKEPRDRLNSIEKNVRDAWVYFADNYRTYEDFRRMVFDTTLSSDDMLNLDAMGRPQLQFNILEAPISRLCGEWAKQEPSIQMMSDAGKPLEPQLLEVIEGHIRHIIDDANRDGAQYQLYRDCLSGGFSAAKVFTEYANSMAFEQVLRVRRVFDPALCGWDPLARTPHKGDGRFCFELYPLTKEEFENRFPGIDLNNMDFAREFEGFNWCYKTEREESIVVVCDYYEKKKKRKKIVKLANGNVVFYDKYKKYLESYDGFIQPPAIVGEPRWTEIETICRTRFIRGHQLDYVETDFKYLPIVFFDGNSIQLREGTSGASYQKCRPYVYNARDLQRLKNFAGQTWANELETLVQHKWMIAKESIPAEQSYRDALTNVQRAAVVVYNAFKLDDPSVPVPPPTTVMRAPIPPEISQAFMATDQTLQNVLGSYDASLGINDNQLSGVAIVEGATQSNATAMPYVVNQLQSWTHIANVLIDLMPKYSVGLTSLPTINMDGSRGSTPINQPNQPRFEYDSNALQIRVEAGVNYAIQKNKALQQIQAMSQANPIFGEFINSKGLKVLVDNMEVRGVDQLKVMAEEFMQELQQRKQQEQQMQAEAMQNNPQIMKVKNDQMKIMMDAKHRETQSQLDKLKMDLQMYEVTMKAELAKIEGAAAMRRAEAEEFRADADVLMQAMDKGHQHGMNMHDVNLRHKELDMRKTEHENRTE